MNWTRLIKQLIWMDNNCPRKIGDPTVDLSGLLILIYKLNLIPHKRYDYLDRIGKKK